MIESMLEDIKWDLALGFELRIDEIGRALTEIDKIRNADKEGRYTEITNQYEKRLKSTLSATIPIK